MAEHLIFLSDEEISHILNDNNPRIFCIVQMDNSDVLGLGRRHTKKIWPCLNFENAHIDNSFSAKIHANYRENTDGFCVLRVYPIWCLDDRLWILRKPNNKKLPLVINNPFAVEIANIEVRKLSYFGDTAKQLLNEKFIGDPFVWAIGVQM